LAPLALEIVAKCHYTLSERGTQVAVKVRVYVDGRVVELEVAGPLSTKGAKPGKGKGAKS
jgi:hypothetical protein